MTRAASLAAVKALRRDLIDPKITEHGGRIVKTAGDGLLLEFAIGGDALRRVVQVQTRMAAKHAHVSDDQRIAFRVEVNLMICRASRRISNAVRDRG